MTQNAIDAQRVSKRYAGHIAVQELSLAVPTGSVYALLGPNGAGKTTTVRMILNIIEPDTGTISVLGRPATDQSLSDRIGYLPEERGLYRKMKVRDVLRFLAALKGIPQHDADQRINRWLDRLSLRTEERDWGSAKIEELSRGMQQKVQFIGALVHDPELVILDEPFSGLDPVNAQALKDAVMDLKQRGKTVIFSTHIIENAEAMCDSVCIIAHGEKVLDGTLAAVKDKYGGPPVPTTVMVQPSLYDIFLQRVGATGVEPGIRGHG
jgi:ABC-2 type transport system ATP-binding protein